MTETLFPPNDYKELGPQPYSEPVFSYLARCGRPFAFKVRDVLEKWFTRYPDLHKDDLIRRFQTKSDQKFISALFELYMHELLTRMGYSVEIHPDIDSESGKMPDFLASYPEQEDIYIEVTTARKILDEGARHRKWMNLIKDKLNELNNPYFSLLLDENGFIQSPPRLREIVKTIKGWLASEDYEFCTKLVNEERTDDLPKRSILVNGCRLDFTIAPRKQILLPGEKRSMNLTGLINFQEVKVREPLRRVIKKKGNRYGDLGKPYIIAVNTDDKIFRDSAIMEALFGQEYAALTFDLESGMDSEIKRKLNGALTSPSGPDYTRVSAVIIGENITSTTISSSALTLYYNPYTKYPFSGPITEIDRYIPKGTRMELIKGKHPRSYFGLPEGWPGNDERPPR